MTDARSKGNNQDHVTPATTEVQLSPVHERVHLSVHDSPSTQHCIISG